MSIHVPEWLRHLLRRPVAVLGAGVSGREAAGLVTELGGTATIFDQAQSTTARNFGAEEAARFGLVVVSPGFASTHEWVRTARSAGCEVIGELDLGALAWPGEIVAITGTNGKTTLTEFLTHALTLAGQDARALGNIGSPFAAAWQKPAGPQSIAVVEVSSFQAETLRFFGAGGMLWSNFAEDHLERHGSLDAYFRAKFNLVKHTRSDGVFYGPTVLEHARGLGLDLPLSGCVAFAAEADEPRVADTIFGRLPQRENFLLARAWWRRRGFADDQLVAAARSFRVGDHRLARVGEIRGVTFWNDSKATNFHAVEAALASFDAPVMWIGGGRSKGGDLGAFTARLAPRIRRAWLLGETRDVLAGHLRTQAVPFTVCADLRVAVAGALAASAAGDHIVLSPGFASFDMFSGYADRGRHFEALVAELSGAASRGATSSSPSLHNPTPNRPAAAGLCLL